MKNAHHYRYAWHGDPAEAISHVIRPYVQSLVQSTVTSANGGIRNDPEDLSSCIDPSELLSQE
jgi:hypothetical protein